MEELLRQSVEWLVATVGALGYPGIFILMTIESSFIPFPSEVVMIPAGYLAATGGMSVTAAILCGVLGSLAGAYLNYIIALRLGRPFILRFGPYVGISGEKFSRVETYFSRHGEITTFVGRLIPGIRQLISFPAGLGRMGLARFSLFTAAGAGLWIVVLVFLGYWIGENEELIKKYLKEASAMLAFFAILVTAVYLFFNRRRQGREAPEQ